MSAKKLDVVVIGAGVSGLSSAVELLSHGHDVTIHTAEMPGCTTSAVAAAIWHPFFQTPDPIYLRRAKYTYERYRELSHDSRCGVQMSLLTEVFRTDTQPPWWARDLQCEPVQPKLLPDGYAGGFCMRVPVIDTSRYLGYLESEFTRLGGRFRRQFVDEIDVLASGAQVVVNCSGYGAATLCRDPLMTLVRGLVLRAEKQSDIAGCIIDDSDARLPTYVIERQTDVILGGTADPSLTSASCSDEDVQGIVARCMTLNRSVGKVQLLDKKIGFRPSRPTVRLEVDPMLSNVVHNYGHGGAGFTLSWGCAADVLRHVQSF